MLPTFSTPEKVIKGPETTSPATNCLIYGSACASRNGIKSPEGIAMPYVMIPRKYMATKKKIRLVMRNSFVLRELNKLRMASSLVGGRGERERDHEAASSRAKRTPPTGARKAAATPAAAPHGSQNQLLLGQYKHKELQRKLQEPHYNQPMLQMPETVGIKLQQKDNISFSFSLRANHSLPKSQVPKAINDEGKVTNSEKHLYIVVTF
ncbi:hypothetical protein Ccrd_026098 [Cynara cardunculus var. scolymus]|uniref:Uncharacterized protein n=1 Tax=Cynara cardunculus var. scolymus TaxID=59895 RepID=A0A103XDE0_CYNCS|nr:hypothetical protein Ccrd_026098 [Cynara cardunculus var. scolymus]